MQLSQMRTGRSRRTRLAMKKQHNLRIDWNDFLSCGNSQPRKEEDFGDAALPD
jgi:hypothetical protein